MVTQLDNAAKEKERDARHLSERRLSLALTPKRRASPALTPRPLCAEIHDARHGLLSAARIMRRRQAIDLLDGAPKFRQGFPGRGGAGCVSGRGEQFAGCV